MSDDPKAVIPRVRYQDLAMVSQLADAMRLKLEENQHKAHWSAVPRRYLKNRLRDEITELFEALDSGAPFEDILAEAADVANFAGMIADHPESKEAHVVE